MSAEAALKNIAEIVCEQMGCSASVVDTVDVAGADLRLPHSKYKFTVNQLKSLNRRLNSLSEDLKTQFLSEDAESVAERLVQGLVCGAAAKDSRFNSKFIVVLHKDRICKSNSLEYLVLLDDLDGNCSVAEGPPGCARLRPQENVLHRWQDFITPSGFLRRDKVIERWVEVLAAAAADGVVGGNLNIEAQSSTAPGYIVQPCVLQHLRSFNNQEQCFYGNAAECHLPSSRDYRIAIVEGNPWVRVRLAGGILAGGAEVKLTLGMVYNGWPAGSDFPSRAPLGHPDALMFYRAAQTGFFIVGGGPGSGVQWSERAAGWQIWPAGARGILAARGEGFARVAKVCMAVLDHLRATGQPPLRAVSRFMVEEALLWKAEKPTGRAPAGDLRSWTANHLAHHLLCVFDTLLGQIRARTGRHYFFQGCDMIKMTVWRAARIGERDWRGDADCLANFLKRLHDESCAKTEEAIESFPTSQERLETALCGRWSLLLQELTPAGSTRGRRLAGAPPYSPRQLSYVAAVARELLAARQLVIQESNEWYQGSLTTTPFQRQDPIEDLIHLLAIILDQARDYFLKTNFPNSLFTKSSSKDNKSVLSVKNDQSKDTIKRHKLKNCYDASSAYLLDSVRRDSETQREDLVNDAILVRTLLRWLYKAVDDDKKYLSPVLKPYLDLLFTTSHENCWHLEEFKSRVCDKELESLKAFCKMVGDGSISPADGILEAATKGWSWAENILDTLNIVSSIDSALRILFIVPNGRTLKFDLSLPKDIREREIWNVFYANRKDGQVAKLKLAEKCVVEAFAFGLDRDLYSCGSTGLASKSEEVLHGGKYDLNFGDTSATHTLRSVRSAKMDENSENGNKYHTLRSIDSKYNTLRNSESLFGSCWTSGNTLRMKNKLLRPTVLDELNAGDCDPNGDAEYSLHCHLRDFSPMTSTIINGYQLAPHREYTGIVKALISMQKYSVLQELAGWLGDGGERSGALKALHRLARGGRRASGPNMSSTLQPSFHRHNYTLSPKKANLQHKQRASIKQYYRRRNIDALSGDESNVKKVEKKSIPSPESIQESQSYTTSPRTREEELDLEVQREYLENKTLHDICSQSMTATNEEYMEMCREVIRESNAKISQSSVLNLDRKESKKGRVSRKESNRSLSVGRSGGKEVKARLTAASSTMGRQMGKDIKVSVDSLLGTCRESRLQHVARKSVLPRTSSVGDGLFGDAFKVSPIYSGAQSEYDLMTQSILQGASAQVSIDRQRHLAPPPRDRFYP